jgi:hypothetical protein
MGGHQRIERRSLELHRAVAAKLRANPERIEIARENLTRWSAQGGRSQPYWDEWRSGLNGGGQRADGGAAPGDTVCGSAGAGGALEGVRAVR